MLSQEQKFEKIETELERISKHGIMLENQIAQQAELFVRQPGTLPPKPEINQKNVQAVQHTLRSGRQYEDPLIPEETYINRSEG